MNALRARFKLWLSTKGVDGVFGDGKWRLLKAVDQTGSLRAASELLRISYRKAWGDIKKAQDNLNVTLVEKQRGGRAGGKTVLTDEGRKLLRAYTKFRVDIEKQIEKAYDKYIQECLR
jgi:molybdate transport system regulatory protein